MVRLTAHVRCNLDSLSYQARATDAFNGIVESCACGVHVFADFAKQHIALTSPRSELLSSRVARHMIEQFAEQWILDVSPDYATRVVAARTIKSRLSAVRRCLPLAAHNPEDPENVHQLRVWSRRATAALKLYAKLLPRHRSASMKKHVKQIRRTANDVCDLDVLIQRLESLKSNPAVDNWLGDARRERKAVQRPLIRIHRYLNRNGRFKIRIADLTGEVRSAASHTANSIVDSLTLQGSVCRRLPSASSPRHRSI